MQIEIPKVVHIVHVEDLHHDLTEAMNANIGGVTVQGTPLTGFYWGLNRLPPILNRDVWDAGMTLREPAKSAVLYCLLCYELLARYGGYVIGPYVISKSLPELLNELLPKNGAFTFFAPYTAEKPGPWPVIAGGPANHPFWWDCVRQLRHSFGTRSLVQDQVGTGFLSRVHEGRHTSTVALLHPDLIGPADDTSGKHCVVRSGLTLP